MEKRRAIDELGQARKEVKREDDKSLHREIYGTSERGERASHREVQGEIITPKMREIEGERPKSEQERIAIKNAILAKYDARYTTEVSFIKQDEHGHTHWKIESVINDGSKQNKPYRNEMVLESGTFVGCDNYRDSDKEHVVEGTNPLHLSEVLYGQIETSPAKIREEAAKIPELKDYAIPEFDLKRYVGREIFHPPTNEIINDALGENASRTYKAGTIPFERHAVYGTMQSKLRLAHYYNKVCTTLKFTQGELFPATEHTFADRAPLS